MSLLQIFIMNRIMHKYAYRNYLLVTVTLLSIFTFFTPISNHAVDFHDGDLIFLNLDCGDLCDGIEKVTQQQFGQSMTLSHVGILFEEKDAKGLECPTTDSPFPKCKGNLKCRTLKRTACKVDFMRIFHFSDAITHQYLGTSSRWSQQRETFS